MVRRSVRLHQTMLLPIWVRRRLKLNFHDDSDIELNFNFVQRIYFSSSDVLKWQLKILVFVFNGVFYAIDLVKITDNIPFIPFSEFTFTNLVSSSFHAIFFYFILLDDPAAFYVNYDHKYFCMLIWLINCMNMYSD